jgi:tetratricopeptide (TPR) repeat protein
VGGEESQGTRAVLRLAAFYLRRKQPDEAEKALSSHARPAGGFSASGFAGGGFSCLIHNLEKALADYRRGESRDHERLQAYQERVASVLSQLGRREEALKEIDAILAKEPKNLFARTLKVEYWIRWAALRI